MIGACQTVVALHVYHRIGAGDPPYAKILSNKHNISEAIL